MFLRWTVRAVSCFRVGCLLEEVLAQEEARGPHFYTSIPYARPPCRDSTRILHGQEWQLGIREDAKAPGSLPAVIGESGSPARKRKRHAAPPITIHLLYSAKA